MCLFMLDPCAFLTSNKHAGLEIQHAFIANKKTGSHGQLKIDISFPPQLPGPAGLAPL